MLTWLNASTRHHVVGAICLVACFGAVNAVFVAALSQHTPGRKAPRSVAASNAPSPPTAHWDPVRLEDRMHVLLDNHADARLDHSFTLTNPSDHTISIKSLRPSCSCTTATAEPKVIPPHGTSTLVLRVDSGRFADKRDISCRIDTDSDMNWFCSVSIIVYRTAEFADNQKSLYLGEVKGTDKVRRDVTLNMHARSSASLTDAPRVWGSDPAVTTALRARCYPRSRSYRHLSSVISLGHYVPSVPFAVVAQLLAVCNWRYKSL